MEARSALVRLSAIHVDVVSDVQKVRSCAPVKMDSMVTDRHRSNHHVISIVYRRKVRSFRERALANGGEEIIGGQREAKGRRLHPEPLLDVRNVFEIHLHTQVCNAIHLLCSNGPQLSDLCRMTKPCGGLLKRRVFRIVNSYIKRLAGWHAAISNGVTSSNTAYGDELSAQEPHRSGLPHAAISI